MRITYVFGTKYKHLPKRQKHLIEQQDEKEALNAEGQFSQNDKSNSLILGKC